jgi:uncharacterized protein
MTHSIRYTLAGFAVVGVALAAGTAEAQNLRLMTGPQGGSWYPLGGAIKNAFERAQPGTTVQVLPGAGIANVLALEAGRADVGFANSVSTVDALEGREPFEEAVENVCNVATLYPQYFQIVVLAGRGIESIDDLKGQPFTTQPTGNTGEAITQQVLEAYDMTYDDLGRVSHVSYTDSVALMRDANAVAFSLGTTIPASAIMDLASARDIKLLEIPDDRFERLREMNPGYTKITVPGGTYPGQDEDVQTIGYATHIVARCDLDEDVVYNLLQAIVDRQQDLAAVASAAGETDLEGMAEDIGVPMHAGAERFFQENGVL